MIALFALLVACHRTAPAPSGPACAGCDVVWITVDTLRYDRVGFYGARTGASLTPAIDAFAPRGTAYRTALAQGPHTLVSVPSYFTSRYLHHTGMSFDLAPKQIYRRLPDERITLAEILASKGYETTAFVANPLIAGGAETFGVEQGFATWQGATDAEVTASGLQSLAAPRERPLFLYLHYLGPHADNPETAGFDERHPGPFQTPIRSPAGATAALYARFRANGVQIDESGWAYLSALYDDAVLDVDRQLAPVFEALEGRERPTLVVFTSDHGESLGEAHASDPPGPQGAPPETSVYLGHYQALWEEAIRVPLVLAGPGIDKGVLVESGIAELLDVTPTLLGLLGIAIEPGWGFDGTPLLGPGGAVGTSGVSSSRKGSASHGVVRDATTKLHSIRPRREAVRYDLGADPYELHPVETWLDTEPLGPTLRDAWKDPTPETPGFAPTPETTKQVEALGYTE